MSVYKQHVDLANERFQLAEKLSDEESFHTAAHLYINACISFHNALCQKFLKEIPRHRPHADTSYFSELAPFLGQHSARYRDAYGFLMGHKSEADYGVYLSLKTAQQIRRKAEVIKEICGLILPH